MMKCFAIRTISFVCVLFFTFQIKSQVWVQKANLPSLGSEGSVGFSIGNFGYIGTGYTPSGLSNQFWKYDYQLNSWVGISNLPGSSRSGGIGFSSGGKGYAGLGWNQNGTYSLKDIYEYDVLTNTWSLITNYPGDGGRNSFAAILQNSLFIGGGVVGLTQPYKYDFWKYNITLNTWTQLASFPFGPRTTGVSFSNGTDIYVGLGHNGSIDFKDLWKYNSLNNSWTQMADFPGVSRLGAIALNVKGEVIVGGGHRFGVGVPLSDYYLYDIASNTWSTLCNFNNLARTGYVSFLIDSIGFNYGGRGNGYLNDLWAIELKSNKVIDTLICNNASVLLEPSFTGSYTWYDNSSSSSKNVSSTGVYWVDVVRNGCTFTDTFKVSVGGNISLDLGKDTVFCQSVDLDLDVTLAGASYMWEDNSINPQRNITQPGLYWVELTVGNCKKRDSINVIIQPEITLDLGKDTVFCQSVDLDLDVSLSGASYMWEDNSINPQRNITQPGLYWVELTVGNCQKRDSINVTIQPEITLDLGKDTVFCQSVDLDLDVTLAGASYMWEDNSINPQRNITQPGLYWVELTVGNCKKRDSINVIIQPEITLDLGKDTVFCQSVDLDLDVSLAGASYMWEDNSINPQRNITQPGLYWVELTVGNCKRRDSIMVSIGTQIGDFLGNDTTICFGVGLRIESSLVNVSFLWQDGTNSQSYLVSSSGVYWAELNENGCISRDSIEVIVNPKIELSLGNDTSFCSGNSILLENKLPGQGEYLWSDGSNGTSILASSAGVYYVQLSQGNCFSRDTLLIMENQIPQIQFATDTFLCLDQNLSLSAYYEGASYLWNTGSTNSYVIINDTGLFSVEVSNLCGSNKDSIRVFGEDCNCYFYLPNVITPNNDGLNEIFLPVYQCNIAEYDLQIYNRWGVLVFQSGQVFDGWDGKFQGKVVSLGSYIYKIRMQVKEESKLREYVGSFTILK